MRIALLAIGSLMLLTLPAGAQGRGTWCSQGGSQGDVLLCAYFSQAQCLADRSGRGGICVLNPVRAYGYQGHRRSRHYR